jgi:hypothetical protein
MLQNITPIVVMLLMLAWSTAAYKSESDLAVLETYRMDGWLLLFIVRYIFFAK